MKPLSITAKRMLRSAVAAFCACACVFAVSACGADETGKIRIGIKFDANPQKNLPKRIVYAQRTISTVTKEVIPIASPAPICVKMYFTPANAAVYTDGRNRK